MKKFEIQLSKQAKKDFLLLRQQKALFNKAMGFVEMLQVDPFQSPPSFEELSGDLNGWLSRRINIQHRLLYAVDTDKKIVFIQRAWSHYE